MTAPIIAGSFDRDARGDFALVVCTWRGACLDIFARAERDVADCIETLHAHGVGFNTKSRHEAPKLRLLSLREVIDTINLGNHASPIKRRIDDWAELLNSRNWIVHGTFVLRGRQAGIQHFRYKAGERSDGEEKLTLEEALDFLVRLDKALTNLKSALGQIRAAAKIRAA